MVASAAVVGGVVAACEFYNNNLTGQINSLQAKIDAPQMQNDLKIVDDRDAMLAGFNSYNDTVKKTGLLFDYKPKAQSLVFEKVSEPLTSADDKLLTENEEK